MTAFSTRRVRLALLPLLALSTSLAACDGARAASADTAPALGAPRDTATLGAEALRLAGVAIARAESLAWSDSWRVPARLLLDPAETETLGAIAEGRVTRVPVRVGDRVRAGQLLVALHSHEMLDARRALDVATAAATEAGTALALAERAAARAERLHRARALSLAELERARGELARAQAHREQTRAELARARGLVEHLTGGAGAEADAHEVLLRAPFDGVVVARDASPGAVALVGMPLVTVSRASSLVLSMRLPEQAVGAATAGASVAFTVPAYPGRRFTARVTHVAPTLDSLTRTIEVQGRVLQDAASLRAEMFATAELFAPAGARTLVVPSAAIQSLEGDTVVVAAEPTGAEGGMRLEAIRVRVGRRTGSHAEILSGLTAGTAVVTEGAAIAKAELLRRRRGE